VAILADSLPSRIRTAVFLGLFQSLECLFFVHSSFVVYYLINFIIQLSVLTFNIKNLVLKPIYNLLTVF